MNCLDNYIGLKGYCSEVTPESGLYINDLSGIDLKLLANISNPDQPSYKEVWESLYTKSVNQLQSDVLIRSQKFFKTNILLANSITGFYEDPFETETSSNHLKGTTIEVDYNTSKYISIFLNHVQLYLSSAVNGNIYIYNLMNGQLLDTIAFTGSIGNNIININKNYKTYGQETKIFVCYDGNIGNSIKTDNVGLTEIAETRGAKITVGSTVLKDNLTLDGDSYGLIANFNLKCDISEFICTSKDLFKMAFYYLLGANIQFERLTSNRLNKYTLTKTQEEIKDLHDEYKEYYEKQLDVILDNLNPNSDQICFSCNKARSYKYLNP